MLAQVLVSGEAARGVGLALTVLGEGLRVAAAVAKAARSRCTDEAGLVLVVLEVVVKMEVVPSRSRDERARG